MDEMKVFDAAFIDGLLEKASSAERKRCNFDLRNAVLQVRQMQALLAKARLSFTPSLNVSGTEGFNGIIDMADPQNTFGIGASASWEIDIFGKLLNAKRGAVADFLQSDAARRSAQTQIISSIASAYYSLLMLDKQLEISEQTVENWKKTITMMESMKEAGSYAAYNQAAIEQAKANKFQVAWGSEGTDSYEAPYILKRGDYYYLFCSTGTCCDGLNSTYTTVVARSTSLFGPYVNAEGKSMLEGRNHEVVILKNEDFVGTGHNAEIVQDDAGNDWIIYHAYVAGVDQGRVICLDRLYWDEDGWPYVLGNGPAVKAEAPVFNNK